MTTTFGRSEVSFRNSWSHKRAFPTAHELSSCDSRQVEPEDEGKYEAVLVNDLGEAKTDGKLVIVGAPVFKERIGDQNTAIDDPWVITAKVHETIALKEKGMNDEFGFRPQVSGNPELTWYKDGVPVKMDDRIKCVKVDDETFELRFSKALAEDNGNWAVIARNDAGEGSQFFAFSAQMLPR